MKQKKTPGVYIVEKDAFPNSVVEVPTGIPVFIGYTEIAAHGATDLNQLPTRISSLADYSNLFGKPPTPQFTFAMDGERPVIAPVPTAQFNMYSGLRLYFDNGGGPCWIVSVGKFGDTQNPTFKSPDDFGDAIWTALEREKEPAMVVIPDAVLMPTVDDYQTIWGRALRHCVKMQSRIALIDVYNGHQKRTGDATTDVISGTDGLRNRIASNNNGFGAVYYPWVNTTIYSSVDATYANIAKDSLEAFGANIKAEFDAKGTAKQKDAANTLVTQMTGDTQDAATTRNCHQALATISQNYKSVMTELLKAMNLMPPAAAMAGVCARIDSEIGVYRAPAGVPVMSVVSPCVAISDEEQEDLNVPLDGMAVNAIRSFIGRGVLVWGGRTLDGNSQDWRYISVRRTMIMLEQSIVAAASSYVFEPNTAATWITVHTMIENFLNNQWKGGVLAGATPEQAYSVDVGLGSTMTGNDILDGYMRVTVRVAVTHPAEFIVITFQQKMQTS